MIYQGNAVSEGVAIGKILLYQPYLPKVKEKKISKQDINQNMERLEVVLRKSQQELKDISLDLENSANDEHKIFLVHLDMIEDEVMLEEILDSISGGYNSPDWAVYQVYNQYINKLKESKEPMIRERAADLVDVRNRILRNWENLDEQDLSRLTEPVVVVACDLLPSDTALMDKSKVLAIITEVGGRTSHSAILARSYGIPTILNVSNALNRFKQGEIVAVDAIVGEIHTDLDEGSHNFYQDKRERYLKSTNVMKQYLDKPAVTKDGTHIDIGLNISGVDEDTGIQQKYVDLVGLFRTEFMYINTDTLPTEEEQMKEYQKILLTYGDKPVILRTLDVGGDKELPCLLLPKEENPFLGKRALRLCFDRIDIFKTQLRAAFRASIYGNLWIMLPMVGSINDIRKAKGIIEEVKQELVLEKYDIREDVKIGIMIEIPSIAIIADRAVKEVDFASIGTNDLSQYLLAADRINPEVSSYCESYHPALFTLIQHAATSFNDAGKPIGVCGELGGDELAVPVLVGLGINKLSMGISSVGKIKKLLSELTTEQMRIYAKHVLKMETSDQVEEYLKQVIEEVENTDHDK